MERHNDPDNENDSDERTALLTLLSKTSNPILRRVKQKLAGNAASLRYVRDKSEILTIHQQGFREKRNAKIK